MKRALIVGIDHYPFAHLNGCVADAKRMKEVLTFNGDADQTGNFSCELLTSSPDEQITQKLLFSKIEEYLNDDNGFIKTVIFYFAGHGFVNDLDGYLVTQDAQKYTEGVRMRDILSVCARSKVHEIVILLDCCYSGQFGTLNEYSDESALLPLGVSVLTSSGAQQRSLEQNGEGLFTALLCDALQGEAADLLGNITIASAYNYIDNMLGAFDQRPIFKSNVSHMTLLRKTTPEIKVNELYRLIELFPNPEYHIQLNKSYEPTRKPHNPELEANFVLLQQMVQLGLVYPIDEQHMYYAAINNKACALTRLGKAYWKLIKTGHLIYRN